MSRLRLPFALTLAALSTLALGAAGCSQGQSPTEPARLDAATKSVSLDAKRHGADDPAGDDHGGRQAGGGADDPAGHAGDDHGGRQPNPAPGPAPRPARSQELEGAVTAVDSGAQLLTLAGGKKIAVTAQTQWNSRGDLTTLSQVAAAVAAGRPTRAEARGTRRADGAVVAQTIKVEVGRR
jgi:hypothetical protein